MPADLYRDAHLGIRARLAEVGARIREREAEVTDAFWSSLDRDVRDRLSTMRQAMELVEAGSFEELARAEGLLSSYLAELDRRIAELPGLEEAWREVPAEVPDPAADADDSGAWMFGRPSRAEANEFVRAFRSTVRERDRDAQIFADGAGSCIARFRDRDSPFALRATPLLNGKRQIVDVGMALCTSVPRATPPLKLQHESVLHAFGKALGIKHEVEVGEPSFDGLFLIQGTKDAVQRLLGPGVRAMLLALARFDVPTFVVDPPRRLASLRWCFAPASKALDAAVRVLASVRETNSVVRFRR